MNYIFGMKICLFFAEIMRIEEIATTTWTGFGTDLKELTGATRDKAISVFGGTLNAGTTATANSNAAVVDATSKAQSYHPYGSMNVAGTISTNAFIKNRLSAIEFHHKATAAASDEKFTFPVTAVFRLEPGFALR